MDKEFKILSQVSLAHISLTNVETRMIRNFTLLHQYTDTYKVNNQVKLLSNAVQLFEQNYIKIHQIKYRMVQCNCT